MLLYFIRHAHALDALDDDARELSPKGERQIERLAKFFGQTTAFRPTEMWHSPVVRAGETARRLARALPLKIRLAEVDGLRPESDPSDIVPRLAHAPERLAIVGHEPHLSALASLLLVGQTMPPVVVLEKAAVIALEGEASYWAVRWHISPDLLE
jgi:phosphohistidine phosphatase